MWEPTLWKSEFMYPFYVNGVESNLLRQFDEKKTEKKEEEKKHTNDDEGIFTEQHQ